MRRFSGCLFLLIFLSSGLLAEAASSEGRVALVIGNSAYRDVPVLPNSTNDARDVATLLRGLGWEVVEAVDVDRHGFAAAIEAVLTKAAQAEATLFYYAGHGLQYEDDNYLLPVDSRLESAFSLKTDAFSLKDILSALEAVSPINLMFLDACRDNPIADRFSSALASRGAAPLGRGLARVAPQGTNTLIAYAAAPGETASDGAGRNSPFTEAFPQSCKGGQQRNCDLVQGDSA